METVSVYDAKTQLSRLVAKAEAGEETVVTKHGRPVARIAPLAPRPATRSPGAWRGRVGIAEGFDDLTEQDLRDWYAG